MNKGQFFLCILFCGLALGCSKSDMKSGSGSGGLLVKAKTDNSGDTKSSDSGKIVTENFQVSDSVVKNQPLRILWTIENWIGNYRYIVNISIEDIEKGIAGFIDSITTDEYDDVEVVFVSCQENARQCMHSSKLSHSSMRTVDPVVPSWDGLVSAALLLAKPTIFVPLLQSKLKVTSSVSLKENLSDFLGLIRTPAPASKRDLSRPLGWYGYSAKPELVSSLEDYFQPGQANVIMSVADSYSDMVKEEFLSFLKLNYGSTQSFRYYAFMSKNAPPGTLAVETAYRDLAKELNGKIFDITDGDKANNYKNVFNDFSITVKEVIAIRSFKLSKSCLNVQHVLLDGAALEESQYSCAHKELHVQKSVLSGGESISVKYMIKSE